MVVSIQLLDRRRQFPFNCGMGQGNFDLILRLKMAMFFFCQRLEWNDWNG